MRIKTFNHSDKMECKNKTINKSKSEVTFEGKARKQEVLKHIDAIDRVPENPGNDIKMVANTNGITLAPPNLNIFTLTIKEFLNDGEFNFSKPEKLIAYKTYLRYLNDNENLMENPKKVFPDSEMFGVVIAKYITGDLAQREISETENRHRKVARALQQSYSDLLNDNDDDDDEVQESEEISPLVKSGNNWSSNLLKGLPWGVTAIAGGFLLSQTGLPAKMGFNPAVNNDTPAQVETSKSFELPKVNSSDKVLNKVNGGALTLFTLSEKDAKPGDKIEFYGKTVALNFDQEHKIWGTLLVFPKQVPIENGIGKFPVNLIRKDSEPKRIGFIEVHGKPPLPGQAIPALESTTDSAPEFKTGDSLTITKEPFISPAQGNVVYTYGDITPQGRFVNYNAIIAEKNSPVVAPARTTVVKIKDDALVLDGGWGLQFTVSGLKPADTIKLGDTIERGAVIGKATNPSGQIAFQVNVNGRPANFFGDK